MVIETNLHEKQKQVMNERKRFNVLCNGRQWGKTRLGCALVLEKGWQEGLPVVWISPSYPMLESFWKDFLLLSNRVITHKDSSSKSIDFTGGGSLKCWSMETYNSARGPKNARAIFDEAAFSINLKDSWENVIRATLAFYQGDAYFLSTPKGNNHFKELYDKQDGNWQHWNFPTLTNPYIPAEEILEAQNSLPPNVFAQEYEGKFIGEIGKVFKSSQFVDEIPEGAVLRIGCDLAYSKSSMNDFSVFSVIAEKDGKIYIVYIDRWQTEINETIIRLNALLNEYPFKLGIEANGPQKGIYGVIAKQLQGKAIFPIQPTGDKITRALPLAMKWNKGEVFVLQSQWNKEFCIEIESFTGEGKEHDDQVDAVVNAYAMKVKPVEQWNFKVQ